MNFARALFNTLILQITAPKIYVARFGQTTGCHVVYMPAQIFTTKSIWLQFRAYITFKQLNNGTLTDLETLLDKTSDILEEFSEFELHATRSELSEHMSICLSKKFDFSAPSMKSITLYLSDEEQTRLQQKVVSLPDGFEFGELNVEKDADFVNQTWTIASAPDIRNTKSKIAHLPNVAVRCKEDGKLVAFVMLFSFGALNHLYTVPEFRWVVCFSTNAAAEPIPNTAHYTCIAYASIIFKV